jgi:hypothetical protein
VHVLVYDGSVSFLLRCILKKFHLLLPGAFSTQEPFIYLMVMFQMFGHHMVLRLNVAKESDGFSEGLDFELLQKPSALRPRVHSPGKDKQPRNDPKAPRIRQIQEPLLSSRFPILAVECTRCSAVIVSRRAPKRVASARVFDREAVSAVQPPARA